MNELQDFPLFLSRFFFIILFERRAEEFFHYRETVQSILVSKIFYLLSFL